jgi:hypothetical protein
MPKVGESESSIADTCALSANRRIIVIADGASRSFQPRAWAESLVRGIVHAGGLLGPKVIKRAADAGDLERDLPLTWNQEELRDRGSFATVLVASACVRHGRRVVRVSSIGDCAICAVKGPGHLGRVEAPWPPVSSLTGDTPPSAASSIAPYITGDGIQRTDLWLSRDDSLLLLTDAMARWVTGRVMRDEHTLGDLLPFVSGDSTFANWAEPLRQSGALANDDLMVVWARWR